MGNTSIGMQAFSSTLRLPLTSIQTDTSPL